MFHAYLSNTNFLTIVKPASLCAKRPSQVDDDDDVLDGSAKRQHLATKDRSECTPGSSSKEFGLALFAMNVLPHQKI